MQTDQLLNQIRACQICKQHLPLGPNPIVNFTKQSKILIIGQAPGTKVHQSGIPWNDPSGERLRIWLNVDKQTFYNPDNFAIVPMGFCYPGKGKSGDLPPRPECAQKWMQPILDHLKEVELTILIGQYAQNHFLNAKTTLTQTVKDWKEYYPKYIVLPHPSPRNNIWLKKNSWFEKEVLPTLQQNIKKLIP